MENGIIINVVNVKPSIFNFAEEHIGLKTEDLHKERLICNKKIYIFNFMSLYKISLKSISLDLLFEY